MASDTSLSKAAVGSAATVASVASVAATLHHAASTPSSGASKSHASVSPSTISVSAFLNRATFGADDASVAGCSLSGLNFWFDQQSLAAPTALGPQRYWESTPNFHLNWMIRRQADFAAAYKVALAAQDAQSTTKVSEQRLALAQMQESFWARAVLGDDQLRHRMAFALSEIFVVSFESSTITPRIAASWWDMLSRQAFGSYEDLLNWVTLHPAMGLYLNIIGNQQADHDPSRHPDENYAREVLQLMSIGLTVLNSDGTSKKDATGQTTPTFSHADIAGLAAVFTGWGWYSAKPTARTFTRQPSNGTDLLGADVQPLIAYPADHSQLQKTFLGASIPAYTGAQPTSLSGAEALARYQTQSLTAALRVIAHHPNVAPFIGRRLIQRFVTSNPSPAYVGRVAAAFRGDTADAYGDLFATLKAVLMDPDAMSFAYSANPTFGKLKEPTLRMSLWLRACEASSQRTASAPSGNFQQFTDFGGPDELDEAPLEALSVFNFFAPDYTPPNSKLASKGLVAPEFQAVDVLTVASYANLMISVAKGLGWPGGQVTVSYAKEILAATPKGALSPSGDQALIDRLNTLFLGGVMSPVLADRLTRVLASTEVPAHATAAQTQAAALEKVENSFIILLTSPEFIVQR